MWILLAVLTAAHAGDATAGKSVYQAKCVACHGATGHGDGPAALALPKPPPDMSQASFWKDMTDDRLRGIVANGNPGGTMRSFPLKPEQMDDLVAYLRTMEPK